MTTLTIALPRPHTAQVDAIRGANRFNVLACGRRWGKTTLGIDRLVNGGVLEHPLGWFSPTYKMLLEVWREAVHTLKPITRRSNIQERRIELITGGTLDMWSLDNPDVARGRKYRRVVVDEAALVKDLLDVWQKVLRPTLADLEGDAWFLSTPKGHNGFWKMYQWGLAGDYDQWTSWQMPTHDNPYISPDEIEAMRQAMPQQIFAQEVLAEFIDDGGGVFRGVLARVNGVQPDPLPSQQYIFGVDWGKHNDYTVITVIDATERAVVHLDRFNQIDYSLQVGRLRTLIDRYQPYSVIAERNSMGEPLIEQLVAEGLPIQPFTTTNASKAQAVEALALAFERGEITIPQNDELISELQAFEAQRLPSGMLRYGAPDGMHDDMVMSLAIGWSGISGGNWWLS